MPLFRWLGRVLLVIYVLIVIVVLGVRYWLLPHIDELRTPITHALSAAMNSQVEIGRLTGRWQGLIPEIQIHDLQVHDEKQKNVHIPYINARIKWRSLLERQVLFSYLRVDGLQLSMWRDKAHQLHLGGQAVDLQESDATETNSGFVQWLIQQDQIELKGATLLWTDASRDAPPLYVDKMHGFLRNHEQKLQFNLQATPQLGLGQSLQLRGHLQQNAVQQNRLQGLLYVQLNELSPAAWRQWIDLPSDLTQATLDTQLWLQIEKNLITDITMDLRVYNGMWKSQHFGQIQARSLRFFGSGPWESFKAVADLQPIAQRLQADPFRLEMYGRDVVWQHPAFSQALSADQLILRAAREPQAPAITIQEFVMDSSQGHARLHGTWTPQGLDLSQGKLDLQGELQQVELKSLYQYFPVPAVSESVVDWLQHGLVSGRVPTAAIRLYGALSQFPFTEPSTGIFYVGGHFEHADIDYYPTTDLEKGWPKVEQATGYVTLRGNTLWVSADQATLRPNGKDALQASQVRVHIDDFSADEPILSVKAHTEGPAQSYLGLMTHTDLGTWLDHVFDTTTATGQWQVPLDMRFNLENDDDLEVAGHIQFHNNSLALLQGVPPLEKVKGQLHFSDKGARAEGLTADWLGGHLSLSQQVGQANQYLLIKGKATMAALVDYVDIPALCEYVSGDLPYQLQVGLDSKKQLSVRLNSQLKGVGLHFPLPLSKERQHSMPLELRWQAFNDKQHQLTVTVDERLQLKLIENKTNSPFFNQGSVTWRQPAPAMPKQGMRVDLHHKELDLGAWQAVFAQLAPDSESGAPDVFPHLVNLRLKVDKGVLWGNQIDQLTYTLQQLESQQWRMDISSDQMAGTIHWQEDSQGVIQGEVQAALQRVHWQRQVGAPAAQKEELDPVVNEFELQLPSINLTIDDLRVDEWRLGRLHVQGRKQAESQPWQVSSFHLHNPHGDLQASGEWHLTGAQRGLGLSAQIQSDEIGQMLHYIGISDVLKEGKGSVQAQLHWHHFPWKTSLADIQADVEVELHHGRINQINSRAAKMLEFLSLQSLSRLAKFDFDLRGLTQNGFPFDDIKGKLHLTQQSISTSNFRVIGPVGTIVLEGKTDIETEQLDLRAVVVPNVDMSGAAIAAGIAVNPVVGIGAFLTQLLFKEPLAKAMTVQYQVTGPWDQLQTEEIKLKPKEPTLP